MKTKRGHSSVRALLSREAVVTNWRADLRAYAEWHRRRGERIRHGRISLELEGTLSEPVLGVTHFTMTVFSAAAIEMGQAEIPAVGSFIRTKPVMDGVVELLEQEFNVLMMLAISGQLTACSVAFQTPRYGRSLISSVGFSSALPERNDGE